METLKEKRNEPDAELNRIANSSIEDLEKEVKKDHNKLMSEVWMKEILKFIEGITREVN